MRLSGIVALAIAMASAIATPLHAQVPFDIRVNTLGFEQRQTLTKPGAAFAGTIVTDGRLILAAGDGGVIHAFLKTPQGFVETHPLYEASPLTGRSLAIHDGRAIVGFEYGAGIFQFTNAGWVLESYIIRSDASFGARVDITDDYAIVGGGPNSPTAIVRREGATWVDDFDVELADDMFGTSVAISGPRAVVIEFNRRLVGSPGTELEFAL